MTSRAHELFRKAVDEYNAGLTDKANLTLTDIILVDAALEDDPDYMMLSGLINKRFGYTKLAVEKLTMAHNIEPRRLDILHQLWNLLLSLGEAEDAAYYMNKHRLMEKYNGREDVFVFGDSHSKWMFSGIPRCKVNWLGPATMHRVGRDGLSFLNFKGSGVPEGAAVVTVFGEIDARAHVLKQRNEHNRSLEEVISMLCENYARTLLENRAAYCKLALAICSVVPPTYTSNNPEVPFYGDISERIKVTNMLNNMLIECCHKYNILYLDVHKYFVDKSGLLKRGLSDKVVHIRKEFSGIVEYELEMKLEQI